jgi:hypothetical protein
MVELRPILQAYSRLLEIRLDAKQLSDRIARLQRLPQAYLEYALNAISIDVVIARNDDDRPVRESLREWGEQQVRSSGVGVRSPVERDIS